VSSVEHDSGLTSLNYNPAQFIGLKAQWSSLVSY